MKVFSLAKVFVLGTVLLYGAVAGAQTNVTPNLGTQATSFTTDRYDPATWGLVNGFQGRNDVLQIGINSSTDASNRPSGQQGTFYNTQGKKLTVNTAGSWLFQSDLFVDQSWLSPSSTLVRTDMWAAGVLGSAIASYPIIGFTNQGGARFRGYNSDGAGSWIDFTGSPVAGWNTLGMEWVQSTNTYKYYVNNALVGSFSSVWPADGVGDLIYQAYNFNDPELKISGNPAYDVRWSNTPARSVVPEPSTYALMGAGLLGIFGVARRRKNKSSSVLPSSLAV
jgi:hypothetical protein